VGKEDFKNLLLPCLCVCKGRRRTIWFKTHCFGFSFEKKEMNLIIIQKWVMTIIINLPKFKRVWLNTRLKSFGPILNYGPKSLGSACIPNPLALGLTLDPIVLGQVLLQDLENLDLPPATPKQLGSGMPFQTQVNNNKNY
jgi:hypothetical protein